MNLFLAIIQGNSWCSANVNNGNIRMYASGVNEGAAGSGIESMATTDRNIWWIVPSGYASILLSSPRKRVGK